MTGLDLTIEKLIEIHPDIEHISDTLRNLIKESDFEPEQVFAIALLSSTISRTVSSKQLSIIQKQLEYHEKLRAKNTELINMTVDQIDNLRRTVKNFLVEFVDTLNSQFEAENIDIKIHLEVT